MNESDMRQRLLTRLQAKVPCADLVWQSLPQVPEIQLALIEESYPQAELNSQQVVELMDSPPYWAG